MKTTSDKKALQAQKRICVAVLKAFNTAEGKKEDARNKLFDIFADHLTGVEDQSKAAKLSIKIFCAHNGHANVKELCEGTGLNLRAEFSMISTVSGLLVDCKSFTDVRRAYDAERANKSKKKPAAKKTKAEATDSEATTSKEVDSITATMHPDLLAIMNKLVSTKSYAEQASAALVIDKALAVIEAKVQAKLKVAA